MSLTDDPALIQKRIAYVDHMRSLHKNKRMAGFIGCLVGVLVMLAAAYVAGVPHWLRWVGLAIIIPSWGLFLFVIYSRTRYVQTHPFDPEAS